MESDYKLYASVSMVSSIKLKFNIFIVDHRSSYYINFYVSRNHGFLQDTQNVIHYDLKAQSI